jgi:hypothetical protein
VNTGYIDFCTEAIRQVPEGRFALLLVTKEEIEVRSVPDTQLANLFAGFDDLSIERVERLLLRNESLDKGPGYREHLVIVLGLHAIDEAWEPPNVFSIAATVTMITAPAVGSA